MFLMEKALTPNGQSLATIFMREDGLFEGRLYTLAPGTNSEKLGNRYEMHFYDSYKSCGVAETLARIQAIVYEEADLTNTEG